MTTHLVWKIPWTEDPSELQSMGLQITEQLSTYPLYYSLSHFEMLFAYNENHNHDDAI